MYIFKKLTKIAAQFCWNVPLKPALVALVPDYLATTCLENP